jgi:RNA polymerase sigma-70 factor, ECF subfamily
MNVVDVDFELLSRAVRGEEKAFRALYDRTHAKIYFYLYRFLGDPGKTEDVLMETYTEVWRNGRKFRGASRVTTWMIAIARNLAINELKRWKAHDDIDDHGELANGQTADPDCWDRQRVVREAMDGLSGKHREVLDLVFYHEMDYKEVAEVLRVPVNTVKTRVFYAKEAMKEILRAKGVQANDL